MAAAGDAADAARRAGVEISMASSAVEAEQAVDVLAAVWPRPGSDPPVPAELARALAHAGNYVAIARRDGTVVGAAIAFRGADDQGLMLHSHITGVRPGREHAGVGAALKLHQRAWALGQGLERISWTFDPLIARNAFFNLTKLGAEVVRYYVDFYGAIDDGINGGDVTDRALTMWTLQSERAERAATGRAVSPDAAELQAAGAAVALAPDPGGWPVTGPAPEGQQALVRVPSDIVALRKTDGPLAAAWRKTLRDVLVDAFDSGWILGSATRDGWYILERR